VVRGERNIIFERNVATRVIITWPAVMLAASRNERVIGRTRSLVDSTKTRNGFNQAGAPLGRRDAMHFIGRDESDDRINLSHRVSPNERVNKRCLERLKMNGVRPTRLVVIRKMKSVEINADHPMSFCAWERESWSKIVSRRR